MKKLTQLIRNIDVIAVIGDTDKNIAEIASDSRKTVKDGLFVAVRGVSTDGHRYIPVVASNHVAAIVCEEMPASYDKGVTYIQVADSAKALGIIASEWFGNPSLLLRLTGVTGTNGKTTTATLLYEMARMMGHKAGLLSTVCNYIDDEKVPATHTTPDPISLNSLLARMADAGCTYAFMEVSSHAADQQRIAGLTFAGGVFSNLTRDHLDYHLTVENYLKAKKKFFDMLPADAFALANLDDRNGTVMLQNTKAHKYYYSLRSEADFRARILETRLGGTLLLLDGTEVEVRFTGKFNAYNLLAVYAASRLLGFGKEEVLLNMSRLVPVAGRFQTFTGKNGVTAIVDYAHTPDALVNVLDTIREIVGPDGEVTTVVGAGGNRDHGKRPMMASEAACRSQRLILTSDNPRDEDPLAIIDDMKAGLTASDLKRTISVPDRREAIRLAVSLAKPGSVILIAGKGHETYQEIHGVRNHFDDTEEIRLAFNS